MAEELEHVSSELQTVEGQMKQTQDDMTQLRAALEQAQEKNQRLIRENARLQELETNTARQLRVKSQLVPNGLWLDVGVSRASRSE